MNNSSSIPETRVTPLNTKVGAKSLLAVVSVGFLSGLALVGQSTIQFEFSRYLVREDEGSVLIGVVRADDGEGSVSVTASTEDGTAQAGLDYFFAGWDKLGNSPSEPVRPCRQ